jgi:plasmid stabilization system protein ParE
MRKILWNQSALDDYHSNIQYLQEKWTDKEAINFIEEVEALLLLLKQGIGVFKESGYKSIKECIVNKHIVLYYRELPENTVELLRFWNTHQDKKNLNI